jgi:hypothetical protein
MVALLDKSTLPSKIALRARAATSASELRRATAVKSSNCIEIRRFTYDARRRLGLCSNDTIGDEELQNSYLYLAPLDSTDPSGTLRIYGRKTRNGSCSAGSTAEGNYVFLLENKAKCPLLVLQEVEVSCNYNTCENGCDPFKMQPNSETYVEAWTVAKGSKVVLPRGRGQSSTNSTDIARFGDFHDKCGNYTQSSRLLLICADTLIAGSKVGDIVARWPKPVTIFPGTYCETSSGGLPGQVGPIPANWWQSAYVDSSPPWDPNGKGLVYSQLNMREFLVRFDCCCGEKSVVTTVNPNTKGI